MFLSDSIGSLKQMTTTLSRARHPLKRVLRNRTVLGVSFPDVETTIQESLEPVAPGIYRVRQNRPARVTRSGVVRVGGKFLSLDYGSFGALRPSHLGPAARPLHFSAVLPLWSHGWTTYYHWLIDVAPKLAAAKRHFGASAAELVFLHPGELRTYERETVQALGLSPSQVINVHRTGSVTADTMYAMPLPGFYRVDHRLDALRSFLRVPRQASRRFYVSRSGDRRISNEDALAAMLDKFGFEFIPDIPRSLSAQIDLFAQASCVVAPHGAALSNLIWCSSGTRILELASASYSPNYFKSLAAECSMDYQRLVFGTGVSSWAAIRDDFTVDLDAIRRFLTAVWSL